VYAPQQQPVPPLAMATASHLEPNVAAQHAAAYADPILPTRSERARMNHETSLDTHPSADGMDEAAGTLQRAGNQADLLAQRGAQALHRGSDALHRGSEALHRRSDAIQAQARRLSDNTSAYIQREPMKAALMAAATGAALMALVGLLSRMRGGR
jgi:ElaB/YqjD/DUF883 family membrane-anchored ribosome-binding protein